MPDGSYYDGQWTGEFGTYKIGNYRVDGFKHGSGIEYDKSGRKLREGIWDRN